jgi:predicted AlkP superfamily pyrophosphatase or phosphodiesterase
VTSRSLFRVWMSVFVLTLGCVRASTPERPASSHSESASVPRVLLISLDGFRWDYIDRAPAMRLRELAARGVRAERMVPIFPTKTFPNHYTIVTGLFAEEHGIVANAIRDSELGLFTLRDTLAQSESRWWGGEPIWVTAERQGLRAASASWPGSEAVIKGHAPTWWTRYWHDEPHSSRITKVLDWLALPVDSGPAIITAYFHDVDSESHSHGVEAWETDSAIAKVDRAIGAIVDGIAARGLTDRVNLIVVSDHGMTNVSESRWIALDDYIDLNDVEIVDWTPVAAIAPKPGAEERVFAALKGAHPSMQVFRKGDVPPQWHFNNHARITPIVAVADEGWTLGSRATFARLRQQGRVNGGAHGYAPELISMGATFIAAGPSIARGRVIPPFQNVHVYPLMAHLLQLQPAPTSGSLDSVRAVLR